MEITLFISLLAYFIISPFYKLEANKILKIIVISIIGTLLLTVSAKIKIPFYPVPMTMQTFAVLFIGVTLGYKVGLLTVSLYLLEGIMGLPVFANSPEKGIGIVYFIGPTMGYLIGFLIAVYCAGTFKYDKGLINTFIKLIFSVSFIYIFGLIWLGILIGWDKPIFKLGAEPFLLAELFKMLLLLFLMPILLKAKKLVKIT
jgi:biotin transport system substrate-specific component|tara:strand:- start:61 stop:663 length:603 start_codon:yes stop_codon:yes gene_type:complete